MTSPSDHKSTETRTARVDYVRPMDLHTKTPDCRGSCCVRVISADAYDSLQRRYEGAVETLVDIAAMGKKAGSESAKHRLKQLGIEWSTADLSPDYGSMT